MRTCVILNPEAGRGMSADVIRGALASVPEAEVRVCPKPEAVDFMVRAALRDGFRRIAAAGGDGTVSEVATALREFRSAGDRLECGVLPIGTGNDLAQALRIPAGLRAAADLLRVGEARPIDSIFCEWGGVDATESAACHAWNAIVGGFGGGISDRLTPSRKRRWRRLAYLRAAVSEIRDLTPRRVLLEVDDRPVELDLLMLVIANGTHCGGGIPLAPGARVDDGALDLVGISARTIQEVASLVPQVFAGRHPADSRVIHFRCRSVRIEADPRFRYNRDGESWAAGNAAFEIDPDALPFVRP